MKHDVIAFTQAVAEKVRAAIALAALQTDHNDVVDTAQALLVQQASRILRADIEKFIVVLERHALEIQHTRGLDSTHGMHAEPITFGLKIANWCTGILRDLARLILPWSR